MTVSPSFFVFYDLDYLEEQRPAPCRMSHNLGLSAVVLTIRLKLWIFGKNMAEVKCPIHHLMSGGTANPYNITGDIILLAQRSACQVFPL